MEWEAIVESSHDPVTFLSARYLFLQGAFVSIINHADPKQKSLNELYINVLHQQINDLQKFLHKLQLKRKVKHGQQ